MAAVTHLPIRHPDAVVGPARDVLLALATHPERDDLYLAGSGALALYLGHRTIHALDVMTAHNRLRSPERRDLLAELLALAPGATVETARDGYLSLRLAGPEASAALRFYYYPYPLAAPFEDLEGLSVVSGLDLGLMKLGAIISRGTRRDFLDLYLLCRHLPLPTLLAAAEDKFGHVRDFPLQALKGLADVPAETEPLPRVTPPVDWPEVAAWLAGPVRTLARERLGLDPGGEGS